MNEELLIEDCRDGMFPIKRGGAVSLPLKVEQKGKYWPGY